MFNDRVHEIAEPSQAITANLGGRELVINIEDLTALSRAGEKLLLDLIHNGASFRWSGIFNRHYTPQALKAA